MLRLYEVLRNFKRLAIKFARDAAHYRDGCYKVTEQRHDKTDEMIIRKCVTQMCFFSSLSD